MTAELEFARVRHGLLREIRRCRLLAGLGQTDLAITVGYSREYVSRSERQRKGVPSFALIQALDTVLRANGTLVALRDRALTEHHARRKRGPLAHPNTTASNNHYPRFTDTVEKSDDFRYDHFMQLAGFTLTGILPPSVPVYHWVGRGHIIVGRDLAPLHTGSCWRHRQVGKQIEGPRT
ncbi:MAG: helix-turn-helix domain-containing protein [Pseudonocardia sp.]|nr:helix-turn-helix domain-containing protein [Pseudonocardia sp.]